MSYILDALKRSEQQRIRGRRRSSARGQTASAQSEPLYAAWIRPGQIVIIVMVLGVLLFLGARYFFRPSAPSVTGPEPAAAPTQAKTETAAPAAAPKAEVVSKPPPFRTPAPAQPAAATRLPGPTPDAGPVRFLRSMPMDFQQSLPELVVNIHVYAAEESSRILYINNRSYRRGDQVQDGIIVEEIVPDGVVLQFRGHRFKLPRPS